MDLGPRSKMTFAERRMDRCKHFSGIQHGVCQKGVSYFSVRDSSTSPYRWPCFKSEQSNTSCPLAEFPTKEEAEQEEKEWKDHFREIVQKIKEGKCPTCNTVVEKRQVGRCVYGSCGHRLYQGTINENTNAEM